MSHNSPSIDRRSILRGSLTVAGAVIVLPALGSLAGCSSAPASLDPHKQMIASIVERIMPATDTPGAIDAGVPDYIANVFADFFTAEQQNEFVVGLDDLASSLSASGSDFASMSAEEQDRALTAVDQGDYGAAGRAQWQQLRDLTIFGFYTSEEATQELAFEEIPGRYDGCASLSEVGSAWLNRGV
ncbi:gluconate 2-dehydrogenase subunit 3 family protein [Erythrobacter crassostreae]|uniref:Gluconate 2-dehydrogenase subunit 3 family protein n=1 Tax=Erythrobacter crassostreae TaxID=2828328 RepID=A0A9X1F4Z9_9SPHN|nr:gluconate 2-dehydrogenase subunit 3 family protein [Erythrobacter crassostrea]MBV7260340.1 gluconate 2-dehydrogenase subunit 3 family protein [Erythrobacter crassostrea]